jgi:hypothetical protein
MALTASIAAQKVVALLSAAEHGLPAVLGELTTNAGADLPVIRPENVLHQNTPVVLVEKNVTLKYPTVLVYCDKIQNLLTEKFRTFSGKVRTVAEVRMSQDRVEGLEEKVRLYVDGVTQVLDANRGDWGQGMFFTGRYEVKFEPMQRGGRNFLQAAKVTFEVDLSS